MFRNEREVWHLFAYISSELHLIAMMLRVGVQHTGESSTRAKRVKAALVALPPNARHQSVARPLLAYQGWDASVARSPSFRSLYFDEDAVSAEVEIL